VEAETQGEYHSILWEIKKTEGGKRNEGKKEEKGKWQKTGEIYQRSGIVREKDEEGKRKRKQKKGVQQPAIKGNGAN